MQATDGAPTRVAVLTRDECLAVRATLLALRPRWRARHPPLPFFTLGAAAYLDAAADRTVYAARAADENPVLLAHFAWLYARLEHALAAALGGPVSVRHEQAVPGFHLYLSHPAFERPIASVHFDRQHRLVAWHRPDAVDLERTVSFTLPIALPAAGGGLRTWPLTHAESRTLDAALVHARRAAAPTLHAYRTGEMVLHAGDLLHQAAPGRALQADDERFTLQGHAVRRDSVWLAYW